MDKNKFILQKLPISWLVANKDQPRKTFNLENLSELANSIKSVGLIQPIIVNKISQQKYQIIAGERRWRACQLINLTEVECLIAKNSKAKNIALISLIENLQRVDLNIFDEAKYLKKLIDDFAYSHDNLAKLLGKSRAYVSNLLRFNNLDCKVQNLALEKNISMGHIRALLPLQKNQQIDLIHLISKQNLSVRSLEKLIKNNNLKQKYIEKDPNIANVEDDLANKLNMNVILKYNEKAKSGSLNIKYNSLDELDFLISKLNS